MTITETCRCGATITAKAWVDQNAYDIVREWRRDHKCGPSPKATPNEKRRGW